MLGWSAGSKCGNNLSGLQTIESPAISYDRAVLCLKAWILIRDYLCNFVSEHLYLPPSEGCNASLTNNILTAGHVPLVSRQPFTQRVSVILIGRRDLQQPIRCVAQPHDNLQLWHIRTFKLVTGSYFAALNIILHIGRSPKLSFTGLWCKMGDWIAGRSSLVCKFFLSLPRRWQFQMQNILVCLYYLMEGIVIVQFRIGTRSTALGFRGLSVRWPLVHISRNLNFKMSWKKTPEFVIQPLKCWILSIMRAPFKEPCSKQLIQG